MWVKLLSVEFCLDSVITGDRVTLKPFGLKDLEFLYVWNNNPEYEGEYEPHEPVSREELEDWLQEEKPDQNWYVIQTEKGQRVGQLVAREMEENTIQIGYRVIPPRRNHGYCTAAVNRIVDHYFSETDVGRIIAEANPMNTASIRVLEKTGFTQICYKEKAVEINGVWNEGVVYELNKDDWTRRRRISRPRF
jgi:ribosomal-protein-alanine N-acetyltransferase